MFFQTKNLTIKYGKKIILENVNISFEKNKLYVLVGLNGSGKTTFFKSIVGLIHYEGEIFLAGEAVSKKIEEIGYSPEVFDYFWNFTLEKFLKTMQKLGVNKYSIDEIVDRLNLSEYKNYKLKALSKGTRKRVSITYSLVNDPNLLLRDEPFDGLDYMERKKLLKFMIELLDKGKTIVISTHFPIDLSRLYPKYLLLEHKKINFISGPIF